MTIGLLLIIIIQLMVFIYGNICIFISNKNSFQVALAIIMFIVDIIFIIYIILLPFKWLMTILI